ncbi:MAG: tRNA (adenosine(37)-N6)-dimethylallyltransferase MiaA [Microscillaceae bacterium]|nr:tRNA (adenosine(37)-N6)-dimethylallyltransferase MiaA [Microscillaceae bacterium]
MSTTSHKYLIVIIGATAVGKTDLSLRLAQHFATDIISADSRQFYREMDIGTAKPSPAELELVKHHLINSHSISEEYSVGQFERDALKILADIYQKNDIALLVGGSGLYVRVVCEGMDEMPEADFQIRETLNNRLIINGLDDLLAELARLDPIYYTQVDKANPQRVLRALEVCLASGKPYSAFRKNQKTPRDFKIIKIGLDRPRAELYARIDARMDLMLTQGLLAEAQTLQAFANHNALQTVGYQEIYGYLRGEYDWDEAVRLLKRNSRRYAKRQLTWFRRETDINWFHPEDFDQILHFISQNLT